MKNLFIFSLLFVFISCATTQKLSKIELGMTKQTVRTEIGEPDVVRGSIVNKYNQTIEVWEYGLVKPEDATYQIKTYYWLYFCDGKLVQWGQAGDWAKEADRIYELRYR